MSTDQNPVFYCPPSSLERSNLNHIHLCPVVFVIVIDHLCLITGDDEDDGGGAKSHFLLWSVSNFLGHHYGSDLLFGPDDRSVFLGLLEFQLPETQEL